jgi:nicotinate-nucleotide adenylyltransferase
MARADFAILGGIFDPLHFGHLALAQLAKEHLALRTVYFVPAGTAPHKYKEVGTPPEHRLHMLRRAVLRVEGYGLLDDEIRREGPSYTIDTIAALQERFACDRINFIIGSDNLKDISSWHRYRQLLKRVRLCIVHRPGYSSRLPQQLHGAEICTIPSPEWGISSTMIRSYLSKGYSCRHLVPDQVLAYASRHRLYRATG